MYHLVDQACKNVSEYRSFAEIQSIPKATLSTLAAASHLDDHFFITMEVHLNKQAFLQRFQCGILYFCMKLKEQEIHNVTWVVGVHCTGCNGYYTYLLVPFVI